MSSAVAAVAAPAFLAAREGPQGPYILKNPLLLESIVAHLPELADIIALSHVCRSVYYHVHAVWPRHCHELSFHHLPMATNRVVFDTLVRHLHGTAGSPLQRRLLDDGRVVKIGGGPPGSAYSHAWRYLTDLDLSGTQIDTAAVKVFIAATSGGNIAGLQAASGGVVMEAFLKDSTGQTSAARLLKDQGLRLTRLCVTDCRNVDINELIFFLRKVIQTVTADKRRRVKLAQHAQHNQQNNAPMNLANLAPQHPFAGPGPGNVHPLAHFAAHGAAHAPAAQANTNLQDLLHSFGMMEDDVHTIVSPLAGTVEELDEYGLACLSLRRLEVANVNGLYVSPSSKYRGKKEWDYRYECPFARNVAHLNAVAGCLGIDVDVIFCQGATCAGGLGDERFRNFAPPALLDNHRATYKDPLPRLPGERILVARDSRVFRIPRHCVPGGHGHAGPALLPPNPVPVHVPVQAHGPPVAGAHAAQQPLGFHSLSLPPPLPVPAPQPQNTLLAAAVVAASASGTQPVPPPPAPHHNGLTQAALQLLNSQAAFQPPPPPAPLADDAAAASTTAATFGDGSTVADDVDTDSTMSDGLSTTTVPTPMPQQQLQQLLHQPHHQNAQPAPGIGVSLDLRRSMPTGSPEDGNGAGTGGGNGVREIALMDGPRGLCEGCGREVWLCEKCNRFWNICCGGCTGQMGTS